MNLIESYRSYSKALIAESAALGTIHHPGERGGEREALIDRFLRSRLPERFASGRGEILASNGSWSGQEDIILYDRLDSAPLFKGERSEIFAAENVAAVIEVKSLLDTQEIERATQSIASARRLDKLGSSTKVGPNQISFAPPTPIFGAIFAFRLDLKFETFWQNFTRIQFSVPETERVNLLCVPGELIVIFADSTFHLWDSINPNIMGEFIFMKAGDDALLTFVLCLNRILAEFRSGVPDLFKYVFANSGKLQFDMIHARWEKNI